MTESLEPTAVRFRTLLRNEIHPEGCGKTGSCFVSMNHIPCSVPVGSWFTPVPSRLEILLLSNRRISRCLRVERK